MRRSECYFPRIKSLGASLCTALTPSLQEAGRTGYDATIKFASYSGSGIQPMIPSQSSR
jgi:hypothetical protein